MAEDGVLTYEDIYELLRGEKNASDLQPLSLEQLSKVRKYLLAKEKLLKKQGGGVFSSVKERAKILTEIDNAKSAMKDLFERRERKVINRALYTLRTDSRLKDTTNMLECEVVLYNSLLKDLDQARISFSELVDESKEPEEEKVPEVVSVKFLEAMPELIDTDLKKHGPFEAEQVASLPIELANVLIAQKKAESFKKDA